jgi:hypothetical protein
MTLGDGGEGNEEHGFSAGWHIGAMALTKAAKFILARFYAQSTFTAFAEFKIVSNAASVRIDGVAMESKVLSEGDRWEGRVRGGSSSMVKEVGAGSM